MTVQGNPIKSETPSTENVSLNTKKSPSQELRTTIEIKNWLAFYIAGILDTLPDKIDTDIPFDDYGLDSGVLIGLSGDLSDWLGYDLEPTLLYDYPTVNSLADHITKEFPVKSQIN